MKDAFVWMKNALMLTFSLKDKIQDISFVSGLQSALVVVLGALHNLCKAGQVDAERHGAVAAITLETGRLQKHRHECDVRVVHGLEI
jgi:hypothetical protein